MIYKKNILLPLILVLRINMAQGQDSSCTDKTLLQEIIFTKKQIKLSSTHKATLDSVVIIAKKCPELSLVITSSYSACHHNPFNWDRVNAVAQYVIKKGLRSESVATNYNDRNSCEIINFGLVFIELTKEEPPHPNMRKNDANKPKKQLP